MLERHPQPRPRPRYEHDLYARSDAPHRPPVGANDYSDTLFVVNNRKAETAPRILFLIVMPVCVVALGVWAAVRLGWI